MNLLFSTLVGNILVFYLVTKFAPVKNTLSEEADEAGMASTALAMWAKIGRTFRCFFHDPWSKIFEVAFSSCSQTLKAQTYLVNVKNFLYLWVSVFNTKQWNFFNKLNTGDNDFLNVWR